MSFFKSKTNQTLGLVGSVLTIADIMQPVAPIAAYIIAASSISLIILLIAKFIGNVWNETLNRSLYLATGLFVLSTTLYIIQLQSSMGKKVGVIASNISHIEQFQNSLGLIKDSLKNIEESTSSIDQKMDNVKKEVSADPKKELANLGLSWDESTFLHTLGDPVASQLFISGGMKASDNYFIEYLLEYDPNKHARELIMSGSVFASPICSSPRASIGWYEHIAQQRSEVEMLKKICNPPAMVEKLKKELDKSNNELKMVSSQLASASHSCFEKLSSINPSIWESDFTTYNKSYKINQNSNLSVVENKVRVELVKNNRRAGMNRREGKLDDVPELIEAIKEECSDTIKDHQNDPEDKLTDKIEDISATISFWKKL